jgi:hypothetical protein
MEIGASDTVAMGRTIEEGVSGTRVEGVNLYRDKGRVMSRCSISSRGKRALSHWRRHEEEEGDMGQKTSAVDGRASVRSLRQCNGTVNP